MYKKLFRISSLILFLFCVSGAASAQRKHPDEIGIFLALYDSAWYDKDSKVIDHNLAPDYVYFSSTGRVISRQETLDLLNSPKYKLTSAIRSEVKVYRSGDTVVVSSRWTGKGTYDKEIINDDQRCSLVLVKGEKGWKVLSEHCTQIVSK